MPERFRVHLIHDPGDHPLPTMFGWDTDPPRRTLIVRPTPGATDQGTLTLDVMAALGKDPLADRAPVPVAERWALCHGWAAADQITDIYVDRAHLLPVRHLPRLAALARTVGAWLWLQWAAPHPDQAAALLNGDHPGPGLGPARVISRFQANDDLIRHQSHRHHQQQDVLTWRHDTRRWPRLPRVDFPRFLAACRDTLTTRDHTRVRQEYHAVLHATRQRFPDIVDPRVPDVVQRARVIAYLRDELLCRVVDPELALVRVRAAQAALLPRGVLLSHQPTGAADPVAFLPGAPPQGVHAAMGRSPHSGPPALLALALHLEQDTGHLGPLRARNLAVDGSTLTLTPRDWSKRASAYTVDVHAHDDHLAEIAYAPARFPPPARPLLAAHRAYRIASAGRPTALLFPSGEDPKKPASPTGLRNAARDLARDIALHAPWVKPPSPLAGPHMTWAGRRGLAVHVLVPPPVPAGAQGRQW